MSFLTAKAIEHRYDDERVLDRVDLDVERGELVCVLGPNGSGKSTLLSVLAGALAPTAGDVRLEGTPVARLKPIERARRVALVPQVLEALPDVRVDGFVLGGRYPYLGLWGRTRPDDHDAVRRALREADAEPWEARRLTELSGGQCQRVLVARALAQEADLLVFDEPTTALDPEHQVRLFALFRRIAHGGRAAIVATHELSLAGCFADRVVLLDGGRVVADGPPKEVLTRDVLVPVYGEHLFFGEATIASEDPDAASRDPRPIVVAWPRSE